MNRELELGRAAECLPRHAFGAPVYFLEQPPMRKFDTEQVIAAIFSRSQDNASWEPAASAFERSSQLEINS